jgi:uncharacterized protein (TIGR02001 family)
MLHFKSRVGAVLLAGLSVTPAFAADLSFKDTPLAAPGGNKFEWTGYVQGTSDYVFRGISQNRRDPAAQAGLDGTYGMFYVGTFFSNVNFNDKAAAFNPNANLEIDVYGGIKPKWGDVTFDFGAIAYTYPDAKVNHALGLFDPTFVEFKAGASVTVMKDVGLTGTIFYTPDYSGEAGAATTIEGSISKPLFTAHDVEFAGSGTLGHTFFDNSALTDYTYWNVGLTATYKKNYSLDLRFWNTDLDTGTAPCGGNSSVFQCGPTFSATAKVAF